MAGWNEPKVPNVPDGDVPRWVQFALGALAFVVGGLIAWISF